MTRALPLPEPCLAAPCRSPIACGGWGYCRERNVKDSAAPTEAQIQSRRNIAHGRRGHAEGVARREKGRIG
jgi:hypothetical protein